MSVAREAAGSSTTWPSSPVFSSGGVIRYLKEEVPAEEVAGAAALHVRTGVDDDVPALSHRRVLDVERRPGVGLALAVGDHLVQGELDAPARGAGPDVDVRDVRGVGLQPADLELDRRARSSRDDSYRPGGVH